MKNISKKIGHRLLSRIVDGSLKVHYSDGDIKQYGEKSDNPITLFIFNERLFWRTFLYGDIGFAESYIDGDFKSDDLQKLIVLLLKNATSFKTEKSTRWMPFLNNIEHRLKRNSKLQSRKNISKHYDLSNPFFSLMLDDTMMYSSAVFTSPAQSLYDAQCVKINRLADKLRLKPNAKVLEIGSGWGAMALHLAKERKCKVTTLTLSQAQQEFCKQRFSKEAVEKEIEVLLRDYRDMKGEFDAIIAIEMFEAVGKEYFEVFFKQCESLLKPEGVLVMQVITIPDNRYKRYCKGTDFIQKYIFPGGHLPSVAKIVETTSKHTRLNLLHFEEFTEDYAKTLRLWRESFFDKLDEVKSLGFDDTFIRMWEMYLCYCEAGFFTRNINLVQLSFSRDQNMRLNRGL